MSARDDSLAQPQSGRLNGWKEISHHLGKSVRTVQRWEREYGLPILRIGKEGGEIIFAFRDELDRWSRESGPQKESPPVNPEPVNPQSLLRPIAAALLALVLVAVTAGFALRFSSMQPTSAVVEGRELVARDARKNAVWAKPLDFEPASNNYDNVDLTHGMRRVFVTDLDRDGFNEVVLGVVTVGKNEPQGVRVFNHDGSLKFTVTPDSRVTFGSQQFSGPWIVYRLFLSDNPDGSRSLWISFIHGLWFPSLLIEVDSSGNIKSEYWSNGYIQSVNLAVRAGKHVVLVGATHNDTLGASLAIFDYGNVTGSAPASQMRYQCQTCKPGSPLHFVIFPHRCIATALNGQATVTEAWIDKDDVIHALVSEGPSANDSSFPAGVWYELDRDLSVRTATFTAGTALVHHDLEAQGRIEHQFTPGDPRHGLAAGVELAAVWR